MTLQELKTKANAKLVTFWTLLQAKQEAYHQKHDTYFQLLVSPDTDVVDGVDSNWTLRHPSDAHYEVDVDFPWADTIPFQISVDVFGAEKEQGYSATVTAQLPNGNIYRRTRKLIDPRVRTQDYDNADPLHPIPVGEPYYVGETSEEDTNWFQVTEFKV
jgi:hypothetical protein